MPKMALEWAPMKNPEKIYTYKIGGTAHEEGCYENQAALLNEHPDAHRVVFHSAISIGSKNNGTTTRIFAAIENARQGNIEGAMTEIENIRSTHNGVIGRELGDLSDTINVDIQILNLINELKNLMGAFRRIGPKGETPTLIDRVVGIGEALSTAIATASYRKNGMDAQEVNLTDVSFDSKLEGEAQVNEMAKEFTKRVLEILREKK